MKCFLCLIVFGLFYHLKTTAQFEDNFSDGNLLGWNGDTSHFIINPSGQLQLNAPSGSTESWIYTPVFFTDSMVWDLYVHLAFAPSTTNQLRIYLALTSPDISTATGYYIQIGASGDQDALELRYLDQGIGTLIGNSVAGYVADEPVDLKIRIVRHENGDWKCYNTTEVIPELILSASHPGFQLLEKNTFGIYCKYTDTRRDKFFFDDISIQQLSKDTIPPEWLDLTIIDSNSVSLVFSENLDPATESNFSNFILDPGSLTPTEILVQGNELILSWNNPFISQQLYTLTISNVADVSGNVLPNSSRSFMHISIDEAAPFEILITEIMADPTPLVGLPDAEYIELFNNSGKVFEMSDYVIKIGTSERPLPDSFLLPGQYLIITDDASASNFNSFGKTLALENMPGLTNGGTSIVLLDLNSNVIHHVDYNLEWYHDPNKDDGGWSLEMINPFFICADKDNWAAAANLLGGTPGSENSQWALVPDTTGPKLISVFTGTDNLIEIKFNERVDELLMTNANIFPFNPPLNISDVTLSDPYTVAIQLSMQLQEGIIYRLLPFDAFDCLGNAQSTNDTLIFGRISSPQVGDVLINEILFNPQTGGSRFIEIINNSQKFIDLNNLAIGRITTTQNDIYPIDVNRILGPGEIFAITPDRQDILSRYTVPNPDHLLESDLPAWDDQMDNAAIISGGLVIDSFSFSSAWHHPVISDQNGVSLERLSVSAPTTSSSNWHSASSLRGYATPTGPNSQMIGPFNPGVDLPFSLVNKHFSPDGDGYKDFLFLEIEPGSGNDVASIWIYDLEGREIYQLLSNENLGNSGLVQWDGRNADGRLADMGIYILFIQLWNANGEVKEFQETCALVKR